MMFARNAIASAVLLLLAVQLRAQPLPQEAGRLAHPPGVALVLSGGGSSGFAHIGVLDVLDSAHVPIDLIVGTSIGAAIGGLYSAGYSPKELEQFVRSTNWQDVLGLEDDSHRTERTLSQKDADRGLLSLRFTGFFHPVLPQAISSGQRLTMLLNAMVIKAPGGVPQDFLKDLRVPFVAVTTDIVHGKRRLLTSGDLTEALRASATLPLRFSPLPSAGTDDSVMLMDGGLMANIPVDVAKSLGANQVIVSNTTAPLRKRDEINNAWDVADQVITLMMQKQYDAALAQANVVITPDSAASDYEPAGISRSIEQGRRAARAMLARIRQTVLIADPPAPQPVPGDTMMATVRRVRVIHQHGIPHDLPDSAGIVGQALVRGGTLKTLERSVLDGHRTRGYSLARIDSVVVHPDVGLVDVFLDEGSIGNVDVRGTGTVRSGLALSELPFSTGDVFRAPDAERAVANLTGTGLYDFVLLQIRYDTLWPGTRYISRNDTTLTQTRTPSAFGPTVVLTLHARASNVIRLGALADNEFGAQFSAELANENIEGTGIESSIKGSLGPLARGAALTLEAPRLLRSFALLEAGLYTGYRDITEYSLQTVSSANSLRSQVNDVVREAHDFGLRVRAGGQFERLGSITGEIRSERQRWFSLRDANAEEHTNQLSALRGELMIDSRNDADYPHTGTYLRAYAETGQPVAGAKEAYTKLYFELEQAIPLSALHTVVPRFQVGFADNPLPRMEQFDLGGIESFYGLNAFELRGKQMIEGSLNYQIKVPHVLFFPTYVSIRYDLGATWPEQQEIRWESLVDGIGAQVGLKTPLGLARFGIGENFRFVENKPHPLAFNTPRFYFSVGSDL